MATHEPAGHSAVLAGRHVEGFLLRRLAGVHAVRERVAGCDTPARQPVGEIAVGDGVDGIALVRVVWRGETRALIAVAAGADVVAAAAVVRVGQEVQAHVAALVGSRRRWVADALGVGAVSLGATVKAAAAAVLIIVSASAAYPLARLGPCSADCKV